MTPEEYQNLNASFFAPYTNELSAFATEHNLLVEEYPRDWPCWKFSFRHPNGGVGSLDVMREDDRSIRLYSYWWIDDFEEYSRHWYSENTGRTKIDLTNLLSLLKKELAKIISWRSSQLERGDMDYEPIWKPYKDLLSKDVERYPIPKY